MFWMYILQCADGSYYAGHTEDLEYRLAQHRTAAFPSCYAARRRPVVLAHSQVFESRIDALEAERQVKGWSRAKKRAFIAGDWGEIKRLARGKDRATRKT